MTFELVIEPRQKDLGGFSVRRVLPYSKRRMVGPWIFFDHMGPAELPPGDGVNVAPHPHINLATVTYLFEGEIVHRDSLGSLQTIRPGDINLMVAGRGIAHSERESDAVKKTHRRVHGLQLWHALPEAEEETDPAFHHYPADDLPRFDISGVRITVMMGAAYGYSSPVKTFGETLYLEATLAAGQSLETPDAEELAVYVLSGKIETAGETIPAYSMAVLGREARAMLTAAEETRLVIIGGAPLGQRHMFWNFVSSRKDRLEQAKDDWQSGRFAKVAGDEDDFIPLP